MIQYVNFNKLNMRKDKTESVSIILPCIGSDARLKLPYSQELTRIDEDMSIVDYSFRHILASRVKLRVIVIIGPHKFDTVRYLYEKYNDKVDLIFISQKAKDKEVVGAIRSVEHLLSGKNILLMPDAIIEYKDKKVPLIDKMIDTLDQQPFVFAHKEESSVTRLRSFGALNIENGQVFAYEDKPVKNVKKYNAFWVSFGFKKGAFDEVISVIEQSTLKKASFKKTFQKSIIYKSLSIVVSEYIKINTWTNFNAYIMKQYLERSGVDPQFLKANK